jgi:hypothetical protein
MRSVFARNTKRDSVKNVANVLILTSVATVSTQDSTARSEPTALSGRRQEIAEREK